MAELARFNTQKVSDFRSMLINYVQLQMHLHRQVCHINNHTFSKGVQNYIYVGKVVLMQL